MTQIRQKLEPGRQPRYFVTEAGIGFRFEAPGDTP
jgi:hypothetical protein